MVLTSLPTQSFADTDIVGFINSTLAGKKITLNRNRQMTGTKLVCTTVADGRPHKDCQSFQYTYTQTYQDLARVVNQHVLSISALQFDQTKQTQLPATALIQRENYVNCGEDTFSPNFGLSVTGTEGHSVAKTQGISTTAGVQVNQTFTAGNGLFGGSTGITASFSMTLSNSTTNTETSQTAIARSFGGTINAAIGHAGYAQIAAIQQEIEVPFSATVVVDGEMEDNISGYSKASQLLNLQERTLPFTGTLSASGLSDAFVGLYKPDEPFNCDDPRVKGLQTIYPAVNRQIPLSSITSEFVKEFGTMQQAFAKAAVQAATQPNDGTSYTVVGSTEVRIADPVCGFDNQGHPNDAIHTVEERLYATHLNGVLHGTWGETSENFSRCISQ